MPKYTLRIPTTEQYAYIEAELDISASSIEEAGEYAVAEYRRLTKLMQGKEIIGLPEMEWKGVFAGYLRNTPITPEIHELMSRLQRWEIHELDNMKARQNYKNPKGEIHHSLTDNKQP